MWRAARDLVDVINELHSEAGFGEGVREFITAGGIYALVHIATTGWPADGRVADSQHLYDQVIDEEDEVSLCCWCLHLLAEEEVRRLQRGIGRNNALEAL